MTDQSIDKQLPDSVYVWWSEIDQEWRIRQWDMLPFVQGAKYVREGVAPSRSVRVTPEMVQAFHDRFIEGADYLNENSAEFALYKAALEAALSCAPSETGLEARMTGNEDKPQPEMDDYYGDAGDDAYCWKCSGDGFILTCCDDLCHGQGFCMHGDGEEVCPVCHGGDL